MEMGKKKLAMMAMVAAVVMASMVEGSGGFSLCNMSEDDLMNCKPAVTKASPMDPSAECCKSLSGANLTCLCSYKNSWTLPSLGIDPDLAMALPPKCNLTSPPECQGV